MMEPPTNYLRHNKKSWTAAYQVVMMMVMMMTIMIRYSGDDDDDGDNYDNIQVTMIRYSGDGPLLGSSAKSSSLIPTPCRFSIILLLLANIKY